MLSLYSNEMTLEQIFLRLTETESVPLIDKAKTVEKVETKVKVDIESGEAVIGEATEESRTNEEKGGEE